MVGFPGSGKTTISKVIHEQTGAVHLWADYERRQMFANPTHSKAESRKLYEHLDKVTDQLLSEGKSVIFDTNFNFYKDRESLRRLAAKHGAQTVVVWITTPKKLARERSVHERKLRNGYEFVMPPDVFERMSDHLQPPREDEHPIKLDGTNLTSEDITAALQAI